MSNSSQSPSPAQSATVRVDKWLWAARMFKTRSQATDACDAGHVKINGSSVKPAKLVRAGDDVEVHTAGGKRILKIVELDDKRGAASVAQKLYTDHTPPPPPRELVGIEGRRERGAGRPTKRDRRHLERLRGDED